MAISKTIATICVLLFYITGSFGQSTDEKGTLKIEELRTEYLQNPEGIDVPVPRLSWTLDGNGRNRYQSAYQILVASDAKKLTNGEGDIWDSRKTNSNATNQIEYAGKDLKSNSEYFWKVKIWDENDQPSEWSQTAQWSMGLLKFSDWQGKFIGHDVGYFTGDKYENLYLPPARYVRKSFTPTKKIEKATTYTTALGLYELRLNGEKIGEEYFLPGWTDYEKRLYYQTYDITDQLKTGENVIGAVIADGWYAGYLGYALLVQLDKVRGFYGENPSFMGQIYIEYEDGSKEVIASDESWKSNVGPILEADILMGETHDAREELTGWDRTGYDDTEWGSPKIYTYPNGRLQANPSTPVKVRETIVPLKMTEPLPETYIFDMGKNIAGIAELKVEGPAGTKVQLRFGEILKEDGTLLTENLRKARATDTYILNGNGLETWQPKFTYHGFQYVEVTGYPGEPELNAITGLQMSSIATDNSTFASSNAMTNTLFQNIKTTQSANFFDIPTDCPQRDERLGWTGDAQAFVRSATYNADVAAFFTKFLIDLDDAQHWYGAYPNFAPMPFSRPDQYSPAWMDAGVIIPYTMLQVYDDSRIVEYMYPGMKKFMDFQEDASTDYLRPGGGNNWGDWLAVDPNTSDEFIASAYFGYDAYLMAEMAEALGKMDDADYYRKLFDNIKKAFAKKYILKDGKTTGDSQTSYALALYFDLYPAELAQKGAARLAEKIKANDYKFSTGFLGTKHVMLALSKYGYHDVSYKLFQQTEYPSWGFSVENGSTSIWERWDSYTKDAGKNSDINIQMNSFSHYAFGSVAEWMFSDGLGIDTQDEGFRAITIAPAISNEIGSMKGSFESINGLIASQWSLQGKQLKMEISIPVNTTAKIHIPSESSSIKENGEKIKNLSQIKILSSNDEETVLEVGSGSYSFSGKFSR